MMLPNVVVFWFRRDLRLTDNVGLFHALKSGYKVLPLFIFDENILHELPENDARVQFIHQELSKINQELLQHNVSILVKKGNPEVVWQELLRSHSIKAIYTNSDYEPYALERDKKIEKLAQENQIPFYTFKDQVIFEPHEILKDDGKPYTVFTPYQRKWLLKFQSSSEFQHYSVDFNSFFLSSFHFPTLQEIGFQYSTIRVKPFTLEHLEVYDKIRDFPALDQTSYLSVHLRFGTVSIRKMVQETEKTSKVFLSELIWREFFMQILYHFPSVVQHNFYSKFDKINWRNQLDEFQKWCDGNTGYPMVDAGMRQLNQTGYMHNRVRMVTASFLTKHLLIDWRWGEAYFAKKLLDFDLSANNGNWQWAAGTGCDAAPYFRVFNPSEQLKKFDAQHYYIKKWIPELLTSNYRLPMVEHSFARQRALEAYGVVK